MAASLQADPTAAYEEIIARATAWAEYEARIRAMMVVGSRARTDHPADAWSDLDLVVFATDPDALLAERDWIHRLGEPVITFLEPTAVGMWKERRAMFPGALDVDVSIIPAAFLAEALANPSLVLEVASVLTRGVRIVADKESMLGELVEVVRALPLPGPTAPDQDALDQALSDFWYHVVWAAKKLRRGELAVAHECLDRHLRPLLLTLVRWHAERNGPIWHGARFLEEWADPSVVNALADTWAHHDAADIARACRAMMDLGATLGSEIASAHGLSVLSDAEPAARAWFEAIVPPTTQR